MLSSQFPLTHRSKLSIPINQSGDGTIRVINETCNNKASIYVSAMTYINSVYATSNNEGIISYAAPKP